MFGNFDPDQYYESDDAAVRLGQRPATLIAWRHQRKGPAYTRIGRKIFYRGADLIAYVASQRINPAAA